MAYFHLCARERVRQHRKTFPKEVNKDDVYDHFLEHALPKETIDQMEKVTRGQNDSNAWHSLRRGLITATKFKRVSNGMKRLEKHPGVEPLNLLSQIVSGGNGSSYSFACDAIEWGLEQEAVALKKYWKDHWGKHEETHELRQPGLVMSEHNPLVGASPDGVIYTKGADPKPVLLVEVKCPHSNRNMDPEAAANVACCKEVSKGRFEVKRTHDWFYQVQAIMGVMGIPACDLVIYTKKGIHPKRIPFDPTFYAELIERVDDFVERFLYPQLLR